MLHDGSQAPLVDADPAVAACIGPVLLGARDADAAQRVHDVEVFGPVATLLPYRDVDHAIALAHRGQGSLVTSLYGADEAALGQAAVQLAASHGRVHVITPDVAQAHTGHGNVMPHSLHGGPGRAGGGAELGGLRALDFYHRRSAVQASPAVLAQLGLREDGPEDTMSLPASFNFAEHLFALNRGRAQKIAYVDDRGTLAYGQLEDRARRLAAALLAAGVKREDRVLLLMLDGSDWPVSFLGSLYAGIVPVAVNTLLTADDYAYMLANSGAKAALVSGALLPVLQDARVKGPNELKTLIVSQPTGALPDGAQDFEAVIAAHEPLAAPAATTPQDHAFWLYSSGSTGKPKGTVHTHGNPWWTAELYGKPVLGLTENDVCFSAAKLYFAYGLGNALTFPLSVGATVLLMAERPTPDATFKRWTSEHKPTVFFGAPTGFAGMLASPALPAREAVSLRMCSSAGEALPGELGAALQAALRLRDHRRHRLHRDAAHLHLQPARRHPLRHHRPAGRRLRDRAARRRRPAGARGRSRRPLYQGAEHGADVLGQPREERRHLPRGLDQERRQVLARRRRLLHLRGPQRRHAQGQRHLRLALRGRGHADAAPGACSRPR